MELRCVWEHNGDDTLLYLADLTGAFTRGATLSEAACKLEREAAAYCRWLDLPAPEPDARGAHRAGAHQRGGRVRRGYGRAL